MHPSARTNPIGLAFVAVSLTASAASRTIRIIEAEVEDPNGRAFQLTTAQLAHGLTIQVGKGELEIVSQGTRAPFPIRRYEYADPSPTLQFRRLLELSQTGSDYVIRLETQGCGDESVHVNESSLTARIENARALKLHRARQYAKAQMGFARAAEMDQTYDVPVFNLACALAQQGKTDDSLQALKPLIESNPAKVYFKVMTDPELEVLRSTPRIRELRIQAKNPARLPTAPEEGGFVDHPSPAIAVSSRGLAAVSRTARFENGTGYRELLIVEINSGKLLLKVPLESPAAIQNANRLLDGLGFAFPEGLRTVKGCESYDSRTCRVELAPNTLTVELAENGIRADNEIRVRHADQVIARRKAEWIAGFGWASYIPQNSRVLVWWYASCDDFCEHCSRFLESIPVSFNPTKH